MSFASISSQMVRVSLDLRVGHLRDLNLLHDGRWLTPLHTAEWVDNASVEIPDDLPNVERYLSGDFLCAPFAESDIEPAPLHGWPPNSPWDCVDAGDGPEAGFILRKTVMGATVEKRLCCAPDAPLLYQTHRFSGGHGAIPISHHVMTKMAAGGRISHSPKRLALTPGEPPEPGLNHLDYPASSIDLTAFPSRDGPTDLTGYPIANGHEDFVVLVEEQSAELGWSAVVREVENDIIFVLKDPSVLPVTMLWYSNGGLMSSPWNGRHRGVLGIEDGCSALHGGHRGSLAPGPLTKMGVPTAVQLSPTMPTVIRHVIGAVQRPLDLDRVANIALDDDLLRIEGSPSGIVELRIDRNVFA